MADRSIDDILGTYDEPGISTSGFQPWPTLPPLPGKAGAVRNLPGPETRPNAATAPVSEALSPTMGAYGVGNLAADTYLKARDRDISGAMANSPMLAMALGLRRSGNGYFLPHRLQEYVDMLKEAQGEHGVMNYDKYLEQGPLEIGGRRFDMPNPFPGYRDPSKVPPNMRAIEDPATWSALQRKRDLGLMLNDKGEPVNPWWWNSPMLDLYRRIFGDDRVAEHELTQLLGHQAASSPMTSAPRSMEEAFVVNNALKEGRPINKLMLNDLTGMSHPNKKIMHSDIATKNALTDPELVGDTDRTKVGSMWMTSLGAGSKPVYEPILPWMGQKRIETPAVVDKMRLEAMGAKTKAGEPLEVARGPQYGHVVGLENKLADEVRAATGDSQAAGWQAHQAEKHDPSKYFDTNARIMERIIQNTAARRDMDPMDAAHELLHGKIAPVAGKWAIPAMLAPGLGVIDRYYPSDQTEGANGG